jgi:20S proteasome alpha/beta subunit
MTILAWDGKILAADKRIVSNGLARTTTKIFRLSDGCLFGGSGDISFIMQMKVWVENGCSVTDFPIAQRDQEDWQVCIIIDADGLRLYERTPHSIRFDDATYACGSGRDYAVAAMHLGKTAKEAAEIACLFDIHCGNGIDTLELLQCPE